MRMVTLPAEKLNNEEEEKRFIEMNGYVHAIAHKTPSRLELVFEDDYYGRVIITARKDCPLFYLFDTKKKYSLKVILRSMESKDPKTNFVKNHNALVIRKIVKKGADQNETN